MSTPSRFSLAAAILLLAISWRGPSADAAGPQLSASSISATNGEPWLLYGDSLDDPGLRVHVVALDPGKDWNPVESLQRVLDGKVSLPDRPPQAAVAVGVYAADAHTAAVKPFANRWQPLAKMVCRPPHGTIAVTSCSLGRSQGHQLSGGASCNVCRKSCLF